MVSLNTSMSIADVAPRPARSVSGLRPITTASITMTEMKMIAIFSTPQKVWKYCCFAVRRSPSKPLNESMNAMQRRMDMSTT